VSDPTYRIQTEHRPREDPPIRWVAHIYRLSDEAWVKSYHCERERPAIEAAQAWAAAQKQEQPGHTFYVDDDGQPVEAHSVKAL
jgi:hypothetical protein